VCSLSNLRLGGGLILLLLTMSAPAAQEPPPAAPFSQEEIDAAAAKVLRDPNLGAERTMKMPRWRSPERRSRTNLGWMAWVSGFFNWAMQSARFLVWAATVCLAAWLAVYLTRAARQRRAGSAAADPFVPPTHVRNLDIRPESLPTNIGGAARVLWDRGEHRAALSLLYRGLLSRLSHVHRVPIRDSSTEGDCLLLLNGRVPPTTTEYSTQLVDAWRGSVYGGTDAPSPAIHALCDGFAGALDRAAARPIEGGAE
jgi:hypothetical protein